MTRAPPLSPPEGQLFSALLWKSLSLLLFGGKALHVGSLVDVYFVKLLAMCGRNSVRVSDCGFGFGFGFVITCGFFRDVWLERRGGMPFLLLDLFFLPILNSRIYILLVWLWNDESCCLVFGVRRHELVLFCLDGLSCFRNIHFLGEFLCSCWWIWCTVVKHVIFLEFLWQSSKWETDI